MLTKAKAVKTVSIIFVLILMAKVLGQVREMMISGYYGIGSEAATFYTASQIPLNIFEASLGTAIACIFIPVFNEYLERDGHERAMQFSNTFINLVFVFSAVVAILGIILASPLVSIQSPGFDAEQHVMAVNMLKIMFPMMVFTALTFSFVGILQSFHEFNVPASISLISNAITIVYFLTFNKRFGIYGLAVAVLAGWVMQFLVLIPSLKKKQYKYRFYINLKENGVKKVAIQALPVIISSMAQPLIVMNNIKLASYLNNGQAVPALNYANKLYVIVVGVFSLALTNILLPYLSRLNTAKDYNGMAKMINTALRAIVFVIFPLMVGFLIMGQPLIRLVYERGEFGFDATHLTSTALLFYSLGMVGFAVQEILNKTFYAMQDSFTPMKISLVGIAINIGLSYLLVKPLGIGGLALAASVASIFIALALLYFIRKKVTGVVTLSMMIDTGKVLLSCCFMAAAVFFTLSVLSPIVSVNDLLGKVILFVIPVAAGIIVYGIAVLLLKVEETNTAIKFVREKLKKG